MSNGPNPIAAAWSVLGSLARVRKPGPFGEATTDHSLLQPALRRLATQGPGALSRLDDELSAYLQPMARIEPDSLTRDEALAYWMNVYNAGALILAGRASRTGAKSVLGVPGGFRETFFSVAGEDLSLDDIEHGKLRRFKDPRVHAAMVCGSVSCPTLRLEPYAGDGIDAQLDDQIRHFLAAGALQPDRRRGVVHLSRVFLWFGADFARPHRMPVFLPTTRTHVLSALTTWLDRETVEWIHSASPAVEFQGYDWGLRCTVR